MKTLEYILPAYFASYLINGDHSGLTEQEKEKIDLFLEREKITILTCGDQSFFSWSNDLDTLGSNCLEFTAIERN